MLISKKHSLYHWTLSTAAILLGVAGGSAGLFIWLNQQGLDHSWQQAHHEPSPWSEVTSPLWRAGGQVESAARARVSVLEAALSPYQDIMGVSLAGDDHDEGGDDGLDIEEPKAAPTSPAPPKHTEGHTAQKEAAKSHEGRHAMDAPSAEVKKEPTQPAKEAQKGPETSKGQIQEVPLPPPSNVPLPVQSTEAVQHNKPAHTQPVAKKTPPVMPVTEQKHILFIGDSMMQGVAPHVITALRRRYHLQSYDMSLQSTGLAYPNFYNWPENLRTTLAQKPDITTLVVFLGPNDPWDMPSTARHGHYLKFYSPAWEDDYRGRIRSILQAAQDHHVRVIWIGPPATKRVRLSEGIGYLDRLFQSETEKAGQTYISVDQLFHYHGHQYAETMELNGHEVRLRSGDGTHFSVTGQKIIAAAVMQELRPSLEGGASLPH